MLIRAVAIVFLSMAIAACATSDPIPSAEPMAPKDPICDQPSDDPSEPIRCKFDYALTRSDKTNVWIANIRFVGSGSFGRIRYDLFRGDKKVFDMSTTGITFVREGERHVRLKVNVLDEKVDIGDAHRIVGEMFLEQDR